MTITSHLWHPINTAANMDQPRDTRGELPSIGILSLLLPRLVIKVGHFHISGKANKCIDYREHTPHHLSMIIIEGLVPILSTAIKGI